MTAAAQHGLALLGAGDFAAALGPLRAALTQGDATPATMLNLAIAEDRAGDKARGRRLMQSVAVRLPDWDEPLLRLAESLRAEHDNAGAEDAYGQVLALNPDRPEALIALGGLLLMRGTPAEARDLLQRCCATAPDNAEAWNTLGLAQRRTGQPALALRAFHRAAALRPETAEYVLNGVEAAVETNGAEAELDRLCAACLQQPLNAALLLGRGMLLDRLGKRGEAIDALEAAVELAPNKLVPLTLLAGVLARSTRVAQAEVALRRACLLNPDSPSLRNDHAAVLMRVHRHAEARVILQGLLDQFGPTPAVLCNLANATTCVGLQQQGVELALRAIALAPEAMLPRRALCNNLPYLDGITGGRLLDAMLACSGLMPRTPQTPLRNTPDPGRRLVVGLLSGSLRSHPVGWLTVAGIEALDPAAFSVVCLAQNAAPHDPLALRFRTASAAWVDVDALSDAALAELARSHGVDIVLDLGGYGEGGRMPACANRLAPVQIKWVGMQSHSSGLAEMDWFITDRWETPAGFERFYSERLLRLPDGYVCYTPPPQAPDVAALPALCNGHVTFGCFNNLAKITPRVLETWASILRRIPDSRLVLKTHQLSDRPTADGFRTAFAGFGIEQQRIELRGSSGHRAFMGQYGDIDMVLDPFPYSGGLTTCEALWMGVPTITLPGEIFASRHSASHMSNAGLADWVTGSVDEYVTMAVQRAADVPGLSGLRNGLREAVRRSPLCDAARFGRGLGAGLRATWRAWCAEQAAL